MTEPTNRRPRVDWGAVPVVTIPAPPVVTCPRCWSPLYEIIRTMAAEADGSQTRRCLCRGCSRPFVVIADPECIEMEVCQVWQSPLEHRDNASVP